MKYSDYFIDSLVSLGYTHCFYVGGGNVMHLLESARTRLQCIAVTHEVSAAIAAEYFNVAMRDSKNRAFAMVTAGPGLTNLVTGIAGSWLESRELLVVGGQARTSLLSRGTVRQVGHQEIDGASLVTPITKVSVRIEKPISTNEISNLVFPASVGRKGPVFLEICLDVTLIEVEPDNWEVPSWPSIISQVEDLDLELEIRNCIPLIQNSKRPLILVGGGLSYTTFKSLEPQLKELKIPVATTWNAADYLDFDSEIYAGRPNTYGMRWANAIIQQCDLLISVGARLGLQQTGFNVQEFAPLAKIIRVDIDEDELKRSQPKTDLSILSDASIFFEKLMSSVSSLSKSEEWREWLDFIHETKELLPVSEHANSMQNEFANPFQIIQELSDLLSPLDSVIPCSSGGAYTSVMQAFRQKSGQLLTNNKGLASMGYGLAGAIGTSFARPNSRVVLIEGDGGFAQNLQEIGTVVNRKLNLKIFLFDNSGYASIRISQKAYFDGNYLGCDSETGIQLPDWEKLFSAWGVETHVVSDSILNSQEAIEALKADGPAAFIVKIDREQPFLPKITSRIGNDGTISSNPIHLMHPPLSSEISDKVFRFLVPKI